MNRTITVSNIQRFSLHDGPGIRTTVFLKGCSLHCPWCANPENMIQNIETFVWEKKEYIYGKNLSLQNIFDECIKDKIFYGDEGGVTFSGGEPLLQVEQYEPLLQKFKNENINLCTETALFVSRNNVELSAKYFDFYYIDIKILDKNKCKNIIGGELDIYYKNVKYLLQKNKQIQFRMPLIESYTTEIENIKLIVKFCLNNKIKKLELIKGHNLGHKKYQTMGKKMCLVPDLSIQKLKEIQNIFSGNGIKTKLCII